jgi:hypothetical protein
MKKNLILPIVAFFLSCNSEPKYTNCIETTFNLNQESVNKVVQSDTTKGNYTIEIANEIKINGFDKGILLNDQSGYSVTNKMSGDTLIIQHLPSKNTPSNVLKFGSEYKFYN